MATESDDTATRGPLGRLTAALHGPNTMGNSRRFWYLFGVAVLLFVFFPLYMLPSSVTNMSQYLSLALLALSLAVVWGYTGVLSFGQVAFFGVAGYTYGIVAINVTGPLGTMAGLVVAVGIAALFAAVLGYFMFYGGVSDVYVTILTLVVVLVLKTFLDQTAGDEWTIGEAALGGFNGMPGIPDLALGIGEPFLVFDDFTLFYAALLAVLLTYLGLRVLLNSDYGRVMVAVREDEDRTEMLGYDVKRVKLTVFTFGGALAGLSGVLYVTYFNYISPSELSLTAASLPVIWVAVGGRKTLLGPIVATIFIERLGLFLSVNVGDWAFVINGLLLLVIVLLLPEGLVPGFRDLVSWLGDRRSEGETDDTAEPTGEVVE
ncbi:amino acid/amide ABC transporter membrane protein 2, HAAT family [Halorientalis persicus]|jgi:urea ABC transporter permease protein UrtC|uniref:Amino acid/amide ABC transporter membrane protein 2, HAAT family n=1 Tax=Halorientalis persicus TaxID=1367881 RepID=A0A1H8CP15_9EURY|nr:urea ABC transporter permease [Halorientalis persicus]SEM96194.1 amino acid/amide ABC transporter membrane protein 2, HAAT family [Halorientalis persicus]